MKGFFRLYEVLMIILFFESVFLLSIYDKADLDSISNKELIDLGVSCNLF